MITDDLFLTEKQMAYALDINGVSESGGWCKGASINSSIAHAITVRGGSGQQRAGVSNFVCEELPDDYPVEELKKELKNGIHQNPRE